MGEDNNLEPEPNDSERMTPEPGAEDSAPNAEGAAQAGAPSRAAPPASLKGLSPGQRLAAKKAQKAIEKREFKDELKRKEEESRAQEQAEAERFLAPQSEPALPDEVQKVAGDFSDFVQ